MSDVPITARELDIKAIAKRIADQLASLPDDGARVACLEIVLGDRCRTCLEPGGRWCCYDSRPGD